jgi:hypothetical protein
VVRRCDLETSRICTPYIYDISHLRVNDAKIREGVFTGPDIRSLFRDEVFESIITGDEHGERFQQDIAAMEGRYKGKMEPINAC